MTFITVRHNIEVAHRLYELEGKCENIHGHSMWVDLKLHGPVNTKGILADLSFGDVKKRFRGFLDETFDHHLLLNETDPWARPFYDLVKHDWIDVQDPEYVQQLPSITNKRQLPGLMTFPGDPTTENLAKWIAEWAADEFQLRADVVVHETSTNSAGYTTV